jgi:hypothetical protein
VLVLVGDDRALGGVRPDRVIRSASTNHSRLGSCNSDVSSH